MKRTLTNLLPALALVLACVMGSDGFAGETIRYRGDGEPDVLARGNTRALGRHVFRHDKGHGVRQDFILAYKWLDLAAATAPRREHDFYLRLRDAVASKMSLAQVSEGQRLALMWAGNWASEHY